MSLPQHSPADGAPRPPWVKIAVAVWLAFVSVIAVVNSVGLSRLTEQSQAHEHDAQAQALAARVGDLERQAQASSRQPKPMTQADFEASRHTLEERLAHLEQAQESDSHREDVQVLQARVDSLEARLKKTPPIAAAVRKPVEPVKAKVLEPPFSVIGLELRGGERFVSIALPGMPALADLRLLREGESLGAWQLQTIEGRTAVFRVDGQIARIALP